MHASLGLVRALVKTNITAKAPRLRRFWAGRARLSIVRSHD